ncbi:MAG TPA: NUDIX domain-containing protein [Actinomycetota bacterium]|nr:NUDIX domain-containing protein [Actinomycetota bacterium]
MKPFDFCPACATRLDWDRGEGGTCPGCGRTWYRNSAPTAGAAIVHEGRALVTQRAIEPHKGRWDVPGGFLSAGEDPIEGLRRELREELGIEVDVTADDCVSLVTHEYGPEGDFVLALGFLARLRSGDPKAADDVAAFLWIEPAELETLEFAWEHDRELVRKALKRAEEDGDGRS